MAMVVTQGHFSGAASNTTYTWVARDPAGNAVSGSFYQVILVGTQPALSVSMPIPVGTDHVTCQIQTGTETMNIDITHHMYCNGQAPGGSIAPCCPPDPQVQGLLSQVLALVESIYSSIPTPLSSLANSTVHAGLTGSGNFALTPGSIAYRVTVTTLGQSAGLITGDPNKLFGAGWITSSAGGSNYKQSAVQSTPQIVFLDPLADTLHYTLHDSVATITELTRGP
jgi:hypothetical protein